MRNNCNIIKPDYRSLLSNPDDRIIAIIAQHYAEVKDLVSNCSVCNAVQPSQAREPLLAHEIPLE